MHICNQSASKIFYSPDYTMYILQYFWRRKLLCCLKIFSSHKSFTYMYLVVYFFLWKQLRTFADLQNVVSNFNWMAKFNFSLKSYAAASYIGYLQKVLLINSLPKGASLNHQNKSTLTCYKFYLSIATYVETIMIMLIKCWF